jgi:hypothetical protein
LIFDLLPAACMGTMTGTVLARRPGKSGISEIFRTMAESHGKAVLEREWRITLALTLRQLPAGMCVVGRDAPGREWFIGPAVIAHSSENREAIGEHLNGPRAE